MNIFYQPRIPEGVLHLDEEESRHCIKVLRRHSGDAIRLTDGKGKFYDALITRESFRQCEFAITKTDQIPIPDFYIHLAISPTKNADRIEWLVEKCVEIGIDSISLITCEHTERSFIKTERLVKVAISAMKQSIKATLPTIIGPLDVMSLITSADETHRYIAHVDADNEILLHHVAPCSGRYLILIGPEGDFSPTELAIAIENKFQKVSLGPSRLRTETAGLAACHILNLINQ